MVKFTSRKFIGALFLSIIGVIFVFSGKLPADQIWTGLQAIWGLYAAANLVDGKFPNNPQNGSIDTTNPIPSQPSIGEP